MADGGRPAAFLDRDGTLIEDPGYLHEPGRVRLLPGAAAAVRRLNEAGYLAVTVTNQSGIARGLYDVAEYQAVQRRVVELLLAHGARLDGSWYCPHHPGFTGPSDCRKPGTRLFHEAATELGI
ncbi:MAG: D-glycero-alpha-D-manno-heptose-1,7-bisphosphate 7-phosphatase, partial [Gemmatimonadales bacterium]